MEKWVALVLALLVIGVGFAVVKNISKGINGSTAPVDSFACSQEGGSCKQSCGGAQQLTPSCGDGMVCCAKGP